MRQKSFLSVDRARRLLALHHRLEAVRHDEGARRHLHADHGAAGFRLRHSQGRASAAAVVRQRPLLCLVRPGHWLFGKGTEHTRGAPCHPQTQGKIERWHQTLKNRIQS
jgi:transposase InsO family protein